MQIKLHKNIYIFKTNYEKKKYDEFFHANKTYFLLYLNCISYKIILVNLRAQIYCKHFMNNSKV
jgi:hypothetical protein